MTLISTIAEMRCHLRENVADDVVRSLLADALEDAGRSAESVAVRSLVGQGCYLPTAQDAERACDSLREYLDDEPAVAVEIFWIETLACYATYAYELMAEHTDYFLACLGAPRLYLDAMRQAGAPTKGALRRVEVYQFDAV